MSSKVMVTGGLGWLGSRLLQRLVSEKREIVCVDFFDASKSKLPKFLIGYKKFKIVAGDIRKSHEFIEEFKDCDAVFNIAGMQHPRFTGDIYTVNRDGPVSLLKSCIKMNVPGFIHISSAGVHGDNINPEIPHTEKSPFRPLTHYAISKVQGEKLLGRFIQKSPTKIVIIRPGLFYGVNPSKNFAELIKRLKGGFTLLFGKEGYYRTYVDIEMLIDAIINAEGYSKSGEAFLIGDREPLNTLQFYLCIADEIDVKLKILKLPTFVSRMSENLSYVSGKFNIHLRLANIIGEFGRNNVFSSEKAVKELLYKPRDSSEAGIREMTKSVLKSLE
ncbi:NAD(P)-dependent oxidoreductase [Candidatus Woesearchaeota archaeon]|nr:NAD(P)-dependent oxidoreductase [Candidatus Woesearchaeota archaeon]